MTDFLGLRSGNSSQEIQQKKEKMLEEIFRILCIFFGSPPKTFTWRFKGKSSKKKKKGEVDEQKEDMEEKDSKDLQEFSDLTPIQFLKEYVPYNVSGNISLINDPRNPFGRTYTVDRLGNVVGGRKVVYLNLPIEDLKYYAAKTIKDGEVSPLFYLSF